MDTTNPTAPSPDPFRSHVLPAAPTVRLLPTGRPAASRVQSVAAAAAAARSALYLLLCTLGNEGSTGQQQRPLVLGVYVYKHRSQHLRSISHVSCKCSAKVYLVEATMIQPCPASRAACSLSHQVTLQYAAASRPGYASLGANHAA
jgi:hypothetical protein